MVMGEKYAAELIDALFEKEADYDENLRHAYQSNPHYKKNMSFKEYEVMVDRQTKEVGVGTAIGAGLGAMAVPVYDNLVAKRQRASELKSKFPGKNIVEAAKQTVPKAKKGSTALAVTSEQFGQVGKLRGAFNGVKDVAGVAKKSGGGRVGTGLAVGAYAGLLGGGIVANIDGEKTLRKHKKLASEIIDELLEKEAGVVGTLLGKNISNAKRTLAGKQETLEAVKTKLGEETVSKGLFKKRVSPRYSERDILQRVAPEQNAVDVADLDLKRQVGKTFNTRVGVGAGSALGVGAKIKSSKEQNALQNVEPNYDQNYQADDYQYMSATASECIDGLFEKEAAAPSIVDFKSGTGALSRVKDVATFARARKAKRGLNYVFGGRRYDTTSPDFKQNREVLEKMRKNFKTLRSQQAESDALGSGIKARRDISGVYEGRQPHEKWTAPGGRAAMDKEMSEARSYAEGMQKKKDMLDEHLNFNKKKLEEDTANVGRYMDNEIAKSIGMYGGVLGAGKLTYDALQKKERKQE